MAVYTKCGDEGKTTLMNESVMKDDIRIELLGSIDELSSFIGLAKVLAALETKERLTKIQNELMQIMAKIAEPDNRLYSIKEGQILDMEKTIDYLEASFVREHLFVLYGGCELSACLDVARAVARRAERIFWKVKKEHGADEMALRYINRLSDYLYVEARYADCEN